jgi:hypothetical protein
MRKVDDAIGSPAEFSDDTMATNHGGRSLVWDVCPNGRVCREQILHSQAHARAETVLVQVLTLLLR